jgi:SWI/SNF-related matrix-associated actin-dependent regulator of chromatin subfamily A member 5
MGPNSKYEGLNMNNFRSDASVEQWEGEDFRAGVRIQLFSFYLVITQYPYSHSLFSRKKTLNFNFLSLSKRERKSNHSVGRKLFRGYAACGAVEDG